MRRACAMLAVLVGSALAAGQVADARKAQVDAAAANAVEGLYRDIARSPLYGPLTVGDLVDKVGGRDEVIKTLQGAQEIGGPRWLDDQTAQVRLEIAGGRVARTLLQLAASNPKKTPMRADALAALLADWDRKTFGAVGTSTGAAAVEAVRPVGEDPAWRGVSEQARRQVIAAARDNAVNRVADGVGRVELKSGVTVAQVMDRPGSPVRGDLQRYLSARPVTAVRFMEDRQVEVGLSVPESELAEVLRTSVEGMKDPALADVDWGRVRDRVAGAIGTGVGVAKVADGRLQGGAVDQGATAAAAQVRLPAQPPEWVWKQLDADARAGGGGSALKCARAAEGAAVEKLRAQVNGLSLGDMTVGEAGKRDGRIADAVSRGLARARVYKSDYHADGTVTVYVSLDLRDVWEELRQL